MKETEYTFSDWIEHHGAMPDILRGCQAHEYPEAILQFLHRECDDPAEANLKADRLRRAVEFVYEHKESLTGEATPPPAFRPPTFGVPVEVLAALYRWYVLISWETMPKASINDPSVEWVLKAASET